MSTARRAWMTPPRLISLWAPATRLRGEACRKGVPAPPGCRASRIAEGRGPGAQRCRLLYIPSARGQGVGPSAPGHGPRNRGCVTGRAQMMWSTCSGRSLTTAMRQRTFASAGSGPSIIRRARGSLLSSSGTQHCAYCCHTGAYGAPASHVSFGLTLRGPSMRSWRGKGGRATH